MRDLQETCVPRSAAGSRRFAPVLQTCHVLILPHIIKVRAIYASIMIVFFSTYFLRAWKHFFLKFLLSKILVIESQAKTSLFIHFFLSQL